MNERARCGGRGIGPSGVMPSGGNRGADAGKADSRHRHLKGHQMNRHELGSVITFPGFSQGTLKPKAQYGALPRSTPT